MRKVIYGAVLFLFMAGLTLSCQQRQALSEDINGPLLNVRADQPVAAQPGSELDAKTRQALLDALADERKAEATYKAVIKKFGDVRPFSNIVNAERRHESFLIPLYEKYGLTVPENNFEGSNLVMPATLVDACKQSVEGEKANIAMYDKFLGFVREEDIRETFTYLRDASKNNHLPAFERCASGRGMGQGRGRQ